MKVRVEIFLESSSTRTGRQCNVEALQALAGGKAASEDAAA